MRRGVLNWLNVVILCLTRDCFAFEGRLTRAHFFQFQTIVVIAWVSFFYALYQVQMPEGTSPGFDLIVHSRVLRWAIVVIGLWVTVATVTSFVRRFHDMAGSGLWALGAYSLMFWLCGEVLEDGFGAGAIAYFVTFLFALAAGTSPSAKYGPTEALPVGAVVQPGLPRAPQEGLVWQSIFVKGFFIGVASLCLAEVTLGVLLR